MVLNEEIVETKNKLKMLERKQSLYKSLKIIKCAKCNKNTRIKDIDLIDVMAYCEPYSCTGGDYWYHSEYNYICSHCDTKNRIMFDSFYNIEWSKRDHYDANPEKIFFYKNRYYELFKSIKTEDRTHHLPSVCNYFIEKNLKKFIDKESYNLYISYQQKR